MPAPRLECSEEVGTLRPRVGNNQPERIWLAIDFDSPVAVMMWVNFRLLVVAGRDHLAVGAVNQSSLGAQGDCAALSIFARLMAAQGPKG
jgi:hypothetical protein